jgi:hypothetical protein
MISPTRNKFLTVREWHNAVIGGCNLILRRSSALECLDLWGGYLGEKEIDVYAR